MSWLRDMNMMGLDTMMAPNPGQAAIQENERIIPSWK